MLVTLVNKAAFATVDFKYPYTLSAIHIACNIIGSQLFFCFNKTEIPKTLEPNNRKAVLFFSIIFTLNIAIGNMSLRWVSVNFNQICRALVPLVVMIIGTVYYGKEYSTSRKLAVVPIVMGVGLVFYGDISTSFMGAFYTFLCVFMAALKSVISNELLTGLNLHPIDLLSKMCPPALILCIILATLQGELWHLVGRWGEVVDSSAPAVVITSGFLSFFLNVSSFAANKHTSALTLCIAANVKQVILVLAATLFFQDPVPLINGVGIIIVLIGSFRYALVAQAEK
jgi:drug/metabolite transporter (DMT)-like permease